MTLHFPEFFSKILEGGNTTRFIFEIEIHFVKMVSLITTVDGKLVKIDSQNNQKAKITIEDW